MRLFANNSELRGCNQTPPINLWLEVFRGLDTKLKRHPEHITISESICSYSRKWANHHGHSFLCGLRRDTDYDLNRKNQNPFSLYCETFGFFAPLVSMAIKITDIILEYGDALVIHIQLEFIS